MVSYLSLFIVAGIAVLNYLYSGRKIFLKSVPVISTVIHGLGASLGFLLGYTYTGYIDSTGTFFAFYFGILYAAGHLNHEIMDNDSDKKSGIPTNATILGKRNSFIGSFILFSISYFYIILLVILDILPFTLIFGVVVSYLLYTYFFVVTFRRSTFDYKAMIWFRQKYRIIFLLWGIFMSLIIVFNK
jgi:4-hydroxybenzoate polyprenyltransferase